MLTIFAIGVRVVGGGFRMATMNVSLPDPMKAWVEVPVQDGRFGNASDYVRDLIRRDQERQDAVLQLQWLIDDGLRSGVSERTLAQVLAEARRRVGRAA
jgi:antitoxin ParD1/3/4